jgi:UDP-4-amino-4,6-dideoxy-N-acetyl-beta-L-altrosamine transaminase
VDENDLDAVAAVLRSDWLTQGPAIERFERKVADYCGARHAVAVCNATAALHIGALALGLGPGDRLWTSPNTFVASANCGRYCGADVDFVDIDPRTYNLSVAALEEKLAEWPLPKVLVPVHFAGQSCDMAEISRLARAQGIRIMEDASHAIGGRYQGKPVGDCRFSDLTVFSFHPVKIITTGEGGMLLTNDPELYQTLLRLRTHGITRDAQFMLGDSDGPWYYQQVELGFNYRMTDIQAALGASQMTRLEEFIARRTALAKRYHEALGDYPLTLPWQHPSAVSAWHLYVIRLRMEGLMKTHRQIFEELRAAGIGVNLHYIPVHTQPYYRQLGFRNGQFPQAEQHYREAISLPMYARLTDADQDRVVETLRQILA